MGRNAFIIVLAALMAAGCATQKKYPPLPAGLFPADGLVTQRAVLTALGKQYALNGYTILSKDQGMRLVVTEMFGQEMADVLVKPDGSVYVMQSSPALHAEWIRRYVAADFKSLFANGQSADSPVEMLSPTHFVVKRRWYSLDVRVVEIQTGAQPAASFDSSRAEKP